MRERCAPWLGSGTSIISISMIVGIVFWIATAAAFKASQKTTVLQTVKERWGGRRATGLRFATYIASIRMIDIVIKTDTAAAVQAVWGTTVLVTVEERCLGR